MLKRLCTLVIFILLLPMAALLHAEEQKILLLGDSLGAGYGIPAGQEWAALLNQQWKAGGVPAQIINASISGDTTAGGLDRLEPLLQQEKPDLLLIELGGNDGLRGLDPAAMQNNLEKMIALTRQHKIQPVLIGIRIPPNYGRKYLERFEQVFVDVSKEQAIPFLPFLLDGVGGVEQYMQSDRIHPNAEAQPIIRDNVGRFLQPLLEERANQ